MFTSRAFRHATHVRDISKAVKKASEHASFQIIGYSSKLWGKAALKIIAETNWGVYNMMITSLLLSYQWLKDLFWLDILLIVLLFVQHHLKLFCPFLRLLEHYSLFEWDFSYHPSCSQLVQLSFEAMVVCSLCFSSSDCDCNCWICLSIDSPAVCRLGPFTTDFYLEEKRREMSAAESWLVALKA